MAYGVSLVFLSVLAAEDIRERKLSLRKIILFGMSGLLYVLFKREYHPVVLIGDLFPGMMLLVLALLTKESIGYGDGLTVMASGLWLGGRFTLYTLWLAVSAAGVFGLVNFLRKKKGPLPFVPFLLLGMLITIICLRGAGRS